METQSQHDTIDAVCAECESPFVITPGEVDFYVQRGLKIPKRCGACRQLRRTRETEFSGRR